MAITYDQHYYYGVASYYDDVAGYYDQSGTTHNEYYQGNKYNANKILEMDYDFQYLLTILPGGHIDFYKVEDTFVGAANSAHAELTIPAHRNSLEIWAIPPGAFPASSRLFEDIHYTVEVDSDNKITRVSPVLQWIQGVTYKMIYSPKRVDSETW